MKKDMNMKKNIMKVKNKRVEKAQSTLPRMMIIWILMMIEKFTTKKTMKAVDKFDFARLLKYQSTSKSILLTLLISKITFNSN